MVAEGLGPRVSPFPQAWLTTFEVRHLTCNAVGRPLRCRTVFLNTDLADLRESRVGDLVQNVGEAHVVQVVSRALC